MALTFRTLCNYADWSDTKKPIPNKSSNLDVYDIKTDNTSESNNQHSGINLHYNIQIHLPETRDMAVYDAIFQSLKKHIF